MVWKSLKTGMFEGSLKYHLHGSWAYHAVFISGKLVWQQRNALRMFYATARRGSRLIRDYY